MSPRHRPRSKTGSSRALRLLIPGIALVIAAVVAIITFTGGDDTPLVDTSGVEDASGGGNTEAGTDDKPSTARMEPLRVENPAMGIGDPDAPLVMVTFESYGCGWCGHFHRLTVPELKEKWVDTGKLRIETRIMPYEERADPGALAGMAAGMQGKYWELAEVMYPYIAGTGEPLFDREPTAAEMAAYRERQSEESMLAMVESTAPETGVDFERFKADYASLAARQQVDEDTAMGYSIGFTGTPAFVVNGVPKGGFASYENMDEFLNQVLTASGES